MNPLLQRVAEQATAYLDTLGDRSVAPSPAGPADATGQPIARPPV